MTYNIFKCAAVALGAAMSLASIAQAQSFRVDGVTYDGTGSLGTFKPPSPSELKEDLRANADYEAWEKRIRKSVADGSPNNMATLAGIMEYGYATTGLDRAGAFDLYEKAAGRGDVVGQRKMCVAYLLGEGRPRDLNKGMGFCDKLGAKDPAGLFSAGYDYEMGLRGPKDEATALTVYVDAGKLGSGEAMDRVGQAAIRLGKPDSARGWFSKGARLGSADAMDHLAGLFERGEGGDVDKAGAYWLYINAARRGNVHAATWVAALPADTQPLFRANIFDGKVPLVFQNITDKAGTHQKPFYIRDLGTLLARYYPSAALDAQLGGSAMVHCYIDGHQRMELCLVQNEYPAGYAFGPILSVVFEQPFIVADHDADGHDTAHTVVAAKFNWVAN